MVLSKALSRRSLVNLFMSRRSLASAAGKSNGAHGGHDPNPELWEKVFYFVAVPAIVISMGNAYLAEVEHMKHWERPEFKPYEYMRVRSKKFPWGDGQKTLFHNPEVNPLPTGWEEMPEKKKAH